MYNTFKYYRGSKFKTKTEDFDYRKLDWFLNKIEDEQFELKINMVVINNLGRININGIENFISNSKKVEFNVIQFPDDLDNYFVSNGHLNEKGNRVLAELLKLLFYK